MTQARYDMIYMPVDQLFSYINNAKLHPGTQVEAIATSIQKYGFDQPISVDSDIVIIKGHGRLLAAKMLGMTEVPVIVRNDLSLIEAAAARIADNKVAESAWDENLLPIELSMLKEHGVDFQDLGFSDDEIANLFKDVGDTVDDHTKEWSDMPEYSQDDKMAFRTLKVHFRDDESINEFSRLLFQKISDKTKSLWFPANEVEKVENIRYESEQE